MNEFGIFVDDECKGIMKGAFNVYKKSCWGTLKSFTMPIHPGFNRF